MSVEPAAQQQRPQTCFAPQAVALLYASRPLPFFWAQNLEKGGGGKHSLTYGIFTVALQHIHGGHPAIIPLRLHTCI